MGVFLVLLLFSFFSFSKDLGSAPVDFEYESKWYNIYKNFHSRQISPSEWNAVISSRNVDTYSVQKKDNLWDISKVLFGDSNYWPKLWSLNMDITNPHRIRVGDQLYVVMGSESEAPRAVMSSGTSSGVPSGASSTPISGGNSPAFVSPSSELIFSTDKKQSVSSASICSKDLSLILTKPGSTQVYSDEYRCNIIQKRLKDRKMDDLTSLSKISKSVKIPSGVSSRLGSIPPSLPPIQLNVQKGIGIENLRREDAAVWNVVGRYLAQKKSDINVVGQVSDYEFVPIRESQVILDLEIPADRGTQLTIIQPLKKIKRRSLSISGPFGYEVVIVGIVEVLKPVPNESGYFFAKVKKLYHPISRGSQVIEDRPVVFKMPARKNWGRGSAQLVGVAGDQAETALTINAFVYLNRGKSEDVLPGEILEIWANPSFHKKNTYKSLGNILIVHADDNVSTGFVTHLTSMARVGDYARPPLEMTSFVSDSKDDDVYETVPLEEEDDDTYLDEEEGGEEEDGNEFVSPEPSQNEELEVSSDSTVEEESSSASEFEEEDGSEFVSPEPSQNEELEVSSDSKVEEESSSASEFEEEEDWDFEEED